MRDVVKYDWVGGGFKTFHSGIKGAYHFIYNIFECFLVIIVYNSVFNCFSLSCCIVINCSNLPELGRFLFEGNPRIWNNSILKLKILKRRSWTPRKSSTSQDLKLKKFHSSALVRFYHYFFKRTTKKINLLWILNHSQWLVRTIEKSFIKVIQHFPLNCQIGWFQ